MLLSLSGVERTNKEIGNLKLAKEGRPVAGSQAPNGRAASISGTGFEDNKQHARERGSRFSLDPEFVRVLHPLLSKTFIPRLKILAHTTSEYAVHSAPDQLT